MEASRTADVQLFFQSLCFFPIRVSQSTLPRVNSCMKRYFEIFKIKYWTHIWGNLFSFQKLFQKKVGFSTYISRAIQHICSRLGFSSPTDAPFTICNLKYQMSRASKDPLKKPDYIYKVNTICQRLCFLHFLELKKSIFSKTDKTVAIPQVHFQQ